MSVCVSECVFVCMFVFGKIGETKVQKYSDTHIERENGAHTRVIRSAKLSYNNIL